VFVEVGGAHSGSDGGRCAAQGSRDEAIDGIWDFDDVGTTQESAMGCESTVPALGLRDLLVSVLVSLLAFLGQIVLAEEAFAAVGDDGPYDTVVDLQVVRSRVGARGPWSECKYLPDDFVSQDGWSMSLPTSRDGMQIAPTDGAGQDPYEYLCVLGRFDYRRADFPWGVRAMEKCGIGRMVHGLFVIR